MSIQNKMQELKRELLLQKVSKMFEEIGYEQMKVANEYKKLYKKYSRKIGRRVYRTSLTITQRISK